MSALGLTKRRSQVQQHAVVIGPTKTGKTALLSALEFAAKNQTSEEKKDLELFIRPQSEAMHELAHQGLRLAENGKIAISASQTTKEYIFDLCVSRGRGWGSFEPVVTQFHMLDGPGGALFKGSSDNLEDENFDVHESEEYRDITIKKIKESDGVILCVDSTNQKSAFDFCRNLPRIFGELGSVTVPFGKFVICLTKCDAYFFNKGNNAKAVADKADPVEYSHKVLGRPVVNTLLHYTTKKTRIASVWTSAYGFVEGTGSPNYDKKRDGLVTASLYENATEILESWRPYHVLDPFVFLATNKRRSLTDWKR